MKVERLVSIILLLLDKKRISAQALAEKFEVSTRTIYRDIDSINMAGIPVHAIPGVGGGLEIMQQYKMDKKVFSSSDLSAILMGLTSLSNMVRGDELVNALAKVQSFVPADRAADIETKSNQLYVDLSPWMGHKSIHTHLDKLKKAIEENRILSFDYADRHGNNTTRTAEPYQLLLKDSHWYFQGYCLKRNDFRLFKLSRITNLQIKDIVFSPREFQKPQLEFDAILETLQTKITLRVHQSILDRVRDFCADEDFIPEEGEYYLVYFPFIENDYYYSILLSFGSKCECLEPLNIRKEMKRRIQEFAVLYES